MSEMISILLVGGHALVNPRQIFSWR